MNSDRERILGTLQYALAVILVVFTAFCFHYNFDLTDEGFYLYLYQWGKEVTTFNFYHIFLSPLGAIFSHKLIFYRYLSLTMLVLAAIWIGGKKHFIIPLSLGFLYFNVIPTFSYNTMTLIGGAFLLGAFYDLEEKRSPLVMSFFIGLMCFFVFSSRFGSGVIFLVLAICFLREKRLTVVLGFLIPLLVVLVFWSDGISQTLINIKFIRESSHQGIFKKYVLDIGNFWLKAVLPPLAGLYLLEKYLPHWKKSGIFTYVAWIFLTKFVPDNFTGFGYYISAFILAVCILRVRQVRTRAEWIMLVFPVLIFFSSTLGTNSSPFKAASYNLLLLSPVTLYFFRGMEERIQKLATISILGLALISVYRHQFEKTYRSPERKSQEFVTSSFDLLSGILIDSKLEEKLRTWSEKVSQHSSTPKDEIFAYSDLPGFPALIHMKAFGTSWYNDKYHGFEKTVCGFVNAAVVPERVFVVKNKTLPQSVESCLREKVPGNKLIVIPL